MLLGLGALFYKTLKCTYCSTKVAVFCYMGVKYTCHPAESTLAHNSGTHSKPIYSAYSVLPEHAHKTSITSDEKVQIFGIKDLYLSIDISIFFQKTKELLGGRALGRGLKGGINIKCVVYVIYSIREVLMEIA